VNFYSIKVYLLSGFYFVCFFIFLHLKQISGLDLNLHPFDVINLCIFLITFPVTKIVQSRNKTKKTDKPLPKSNIRKKYEDHGESFAQIQYSPAWSSHGLGNESGEWIFLLFKNGLIYIISPLILLIFFLKFMKEEKDN
jgi:hypothetical protein